jgi:tetratricopeptide (TPR) repeat protein
MKWFSALAAACLVAAAPLVHAIGPDEDYISIYQMIEDGDQLLANNQTSAARAKFQAAEAALKKFKATYPVWNEKTVEFRQQYVAEKLSKLAPATAPTAPAITTPTIKPAVADPTAELRQQVAQLQEQNKVLNAKLQEALTAQPAAVDPRELQKAEVQVNALQKERDLLKVALEQEQAKVAKASDKSGLEAAQKEIASLRSQLAATAAPATASEKEIAAAREAARTNALAVSALQLALKDMREERDAVLTRAAQASLRGETNGAPAEKRIKELEQERDDLVKRLNSANKELSDGKGKDKNVSGRDENARIAVLRARLEALEARKVPYTPEELAALKQGPLATRNMPDKKETKRKELPVGAGVLIQEAQRAFAAKDYAKAEDRYQQVLKMDDKNIVVLGNLGLIQMEAGRLNDAEATLTKASSIDPSDAFVMSQLGILRFRQQKVDEAIDLLSRAAEADPKNAETQNYLGIALSEKGLRAPAETALRKAVELNPNYAVAHHNLAVVYASQHPPFIELAKYHYNKSLDLGHAADPAIEKMLNKPKP